MEQISLLHLPHLLHQGGAALFHGREEGKTSCPPLSSPEFPGTLYRNRAREDPSLHGHVDACTE